MYDKLKIGFMVCAILAIAVGLGTIVAHVFVGYAAQAATLPTVLALFCLAAVAGLLAACLAPKGERLNAWGSAALWMVYGAMVLGQYTHPSNELRAAMEARAR